MLRNEISNSEIASRYDNVSRFYQYRPNYSPSFFKTVLEQAHPRKDLGQLMVVDIGSGNGASRKALVAAGCNPINVFEIEPNAAMRELSRKDGGIHVISGTAADTHLTNAQSDVVIFCNSIHQATTDEKDIIKIQSELNRITTPGGKIIFVAQRFDPQDKTIQALHNACEQWKKDNLYPSYGDNGIKFILNSFSGAENTKSILNGYPEKFMENGYQENISTHYIEYNEEEFLGLMRSYLSFPAPASEKLISNVKNFFRQHANEEKNIITMPCIQVAITGKPLAMLSPKKILSNL